MPTPPSEEAPGEADDGKALAAFRAKARQVATDLANTVDEAWALPAAARLPLVQRLAEQLEAGGLQAGTLVNHPVQASRALQLLLAHRDALDERLAQAAHVAASFMDVTRLPDLDDLVTAICRAGDSAWSVSLVFWLRQDDRLRTRFPAMGRKLAALLLDPTVPSLRR